MLKMKRQLPVAEQQKVKVYRNLNNKCLSVMRKGLVIGHAQTVCLTNVQFQVNEKGRERCIKEKRKNVHAFVIGCLESASENISSIEGLTKVSYNPYRANYFYNIETGEPIHRCSSVLVTSIGVFIETN